MSERINHAKEAQRLISAIDPKHFACDCVPGLGPPHCHGCSDAEGKPITWNERTCQACEEHEDE